MGACFSSREEEPKNIDEEEESNQTTSNVESPEEEEVPLVTPAVGTNGREHATCAPHSTSTSTDTTTLTEEKVSPEAESQEDMNINSATEEAKEVQPGSASSHEKEVTIKNTPQIINKPQMEEAVEKNPKMKAAKHTPFPGKQEKESITMEQMIEELGATNRTNLDKVMEAFPEVDLNTIVGLFDTICPMEDDPMSPISAVTMTPPMVAIQFDGHYEIDEELGAGAFGQVFLAFATEENPILAYETEVAMKRIDNFFENAGLVKRLVRELRVLRALNDHPAVVKMLDLKMDDHDFDKFHILYVVMEKADKDLKRVINNKDQWCSAEQVASMIKQLFCGLKYMHSANLVHRDLKPQNILYWEGQNGEVIVKLCDFGLARCTKINTARRLPKGWMKNAKEHGLSENYEKRKYAFSKKVTGHIVTRYYRPPEVSARTSWMNDRDLMPAIDIWSMGCIMGEMLQLIKGNMKQGQTKRKVLIKGGADMAYSPGGTYVHDSGVEFTKKMEQLEAVLRLVGKPSQEFIDHITDQDSRQLVDAIMQKDFEGVDLAAVFPASDEDCLDFLRQCLELNPNKRLTVEQALEHPYLANATLPASDEEYNRVHEEMFFEFEDINLSEMELRCLLVNEVVKVQEEKQLYVQPESSLPGPANITTIEEEYMPKPQGVEVVSTGVNITSIVGATPAQAVRAQPLPEEPVVEEVNETEDASPKKEAVEVETEVPAVNEEETEEPVVEETIEPTVEEPEEPVVEETIEPTVEETEELVVEETIEPTVEETEEPVVEETEEPVVEETATKKEAVEVETESSEEIVTLNHATEEEL